MNSTHRSPERALILQNYLLLHSRRDALRKHLNESSTLPRHAPSSPSKSPNQPQHNSLSFGSEHRYLSSAPLLALQHEQHQNSRNGRFRAMQPEADIHEGFFEEIEEYETKLRNVIEQIRYTLMDLLNCDGVRGDKGYSAWVQSRLMDVEKEMTDFGSRNHENRSSAGAFETML